MQAMDKQEARMMLQTYRPGGRDADDPAFAEALSLARQDPELGEWFKRECELDAAISDRLRQGAVPVDLRQAILTGHRSQRQVVRRWPTWWRSPALAWAASVAILVTAGFFFQTNRTSRAVPISITAYRNAMAANLNEPFVFDLRNDQPDQLRLWLTKNQVFQKLELPELLRNGTAIGCKVFEYENLKPALICFTLADKQVVHLFVVEAKAFDGSWVGPDPSLCRCDRWNACFWRKDDLVYLLMSGVGVDAGRLAGIAGLGKMGLPP